MIGGYFMNEHYLEINELISKVTQELKKAQFSDQRIIKYIPTWSKLKNYLELKKKVIFDAKTALDFLDEAYGITVFENLPTKIAIHVRAVNLLADYQLHGIVLSKAKRRIHTYHPQFQDVFQGFIDVKRHGCISEDTLRSYAIYLDRFSDYLNNQNVHDIKELNNSLVLGFSNTFLNYSPAVIHCTLCALRTFFHYLYQQGISLKDFAYIVPHDGYRGSSKIPSAYPKEDVEKLLVSVDRGNPKGKRDYAIILLAARLGMRAHDICNLSFQNLKWETNTIEIIQGKTNKLIVLPLLEEIGIAIIDYLKYARPDVENNTIFFRLIPPIAQLEETTLHSIVTHQMNIAGIKIQDGKKHGPHALRHSLASALLEENTPLPVISEILGHTNTSSTSVYLKIDINQLRSCSLQTLPFDWNKGSEVF